MKFNIQSKLLLTRLSAVSKVISSKNAYAILDNFLFELDHSTLTVTGSDMETRLTTTMEVQDAEGSGSFAIDVKKLMDLLKTLPDTALSFEIDDNTLQSVIKYINGEFKIMAFAGDEYPEKSAQENVNTLKLKPKTIINGLQSSLFAVGTDDMHPQFMGIYWDIKPDMIVFVASDSHKLVRFRQTGIEPGIEKSFILPTKPASILMGIIDKNSEEDVQLTIDDGSATFETNEYTLSCRFINGRYPNYNSVIPENNPYSVFIDRLTFLNALRRVSVFASVGGMIKVSLKSNNMLLSTQDLDHSTSANETLQCEYDGPEMSVGFKNTEIIDVVNNIGSETIYLKLIDPARAGIFLPGEQEAGADLLVLQMPMML